MSDPANDRKPEEVQEAQTENLKGIFVEIDVVVGDVMPRPIRSPKMLRIRPDQPPPPSQEPPAKW